LEGLSARKKGTNNGMRGRKEKKETGGEKKNAIISIRKEGDRFGRKKDESLGDKGERRRLKKGSRWGTKGRWGKKTTNTITKHWGK